MTQPPFPLNALATLNPVRPASRLSAIPEFPSLSDRALGVYNSKAYTFGAHMGTPGPFVSEINDLAENVNYNAGVAMSAAEAAVQASGDSGLKLAEVQQLRDEAEGFKNAAGTSAQASAGSATTAGQQAQAASQSASSASQSAQTATQAKSDAEAAAVAAAASRDEARDFATQQLVAASSTVMTPGVGVKNLMIEPSKSFVVGMYLVVTSSGETSNTFSGAVQSYNKDTGALSLAVDKFSGTGSRSDWIIGLAAKSSDGALTQEVITVDTQGVPGVMYIVAGDLTLTLPQTGLANGDRIGIRLVVPVTYNQFVDFGSVQFMGQQAGLRYLDTRGFGRDLTYNETGGWV